MPIKKINEAIVGEYHFISGPDYFAVTLDGRELLVITPEEFHEVVEWFMIDCQSAKSTVEFDSKLLRELGKLKVDNKIAASETVVYDPGDRKATQSEQIPGLNISAGESIGVVDLGALKGPAPKGTVRAAQKHMPEGLPEPDIRPL